MQTAKMAIIHIFFIVLYFEPQKYKKSLFLLGIGWFISTEG